MLIRVLTCIFLFSLACQTNAQVPVQDPEVEALWQNFQSIDLSHASRSSIDPLEFSDMLNSAARLQVEAEHGLRELSRRDHVRLQAILSYSPPSGSSITPSKQQSSTPETARGPTTATISGYVRESGTNADITSGSVQAIPFGSPFSSSATILGDGTYSITNLEPGHYVLHVTSPEHVRQAWPDIECVNRNLCHSWYGGEVVEVSPGDTLTRNFDAVDRGIRVAGNVTDENGDPVENARVWVLARNGVVSSSGNTDAVGNYQTTSALPPGEYRIFAASNDTGLIGSTHDGQPCGHYSNDCRNQLTSFVTLTDINSPVTFDFDLGSGRNMQSGFGLSGQVFDEDGTTPLENASVQLTSTDGSRFYSASTDATGAYSIDAVPDDDYLVFIWHPERLALVHPNIECFGFSCDTEVGTPVALGASAQTLDFNLSAGASVSGQVLKQSDGLPVEGVQVWVSNSIQGTGTTVTEASGNFTVQGLPEGIFYVQARPANDETDPAIAQLQRTFLGDVNCPASNCGDFGQPITIPEDGAIGGLTLNMPIGGGISGQMIDGESGLPAPAIFIGRLELWVASGPFKGELAGQGLLPYDFSNPTPTGEYEIRGLMPGAYKATFGTSSHLGLIDTGFGGQPCPRGSCNLDDLPTVFVTAGAVLPDIGATLPRGPVISGQVLDAATGEPPPPPITQTASRFMSFYGTSGNYAGFSSVDDSGRFRSRTGFPAGTFFAATFLARNNWSFGDNYIDQAHDGVDCPFLQCNLTAAATAIDITTVDVENIDFAVRQGGRISGTITDADNAALLLSGIGVEVYDGAGRKVAEAVTNTQGEYLVEALPGGSYTVRTRNNRGYQDKLHDGFGCTPFCNPVNGTTVSVTEGATVSGINFDLIRSVAISGTVTVDGVPAENITVEVYGAVGNLITETLSAADGSYAFTSLAPGEFYLRTRNSFGHADTLYMSHSCVGDACQVRRGTRIELEPGEEQSAVGLNLMPGALISGEVHDRTNPATKLSGVTVQLLNDRGAVAYEATTGLSGQFSFDSLAAGDYHLVTRQTPNYIDQTLGGAPCSSVCNGLGGNVITIAAGAMDTGKDLDLAPGASISGSVLAGGSPAVGAQAEVYNAAGQPVTSRPTNASGNYEIGNLPDGDFFVRVSKVPGFVSQLFDGIACSGFCDILNGDEVSIVGNSDVGSIDFSLSAGGSIAGTVTGGGSPLPGVELVAYDNAGFVAGQAVTNASGQYTIQGLVDGNYRLRSANVGGFIDRVYGGDSCSPTACNINDGSAIAVSGATVSGIDFALDPGSSIAGTATDPFGNPLPDGTAVLLDASGLQVTTTPINDGLWSFDGLSDGTYYLLIENNLGLVDELFDDVPCPGGSCDITGLGTPITIGAGPLSVGARGSTSTAIDVSLGEGAAISGQVVDASTSDPLVGVVVYFFNENGELVGSSSPTDGLGEYESGGGLPVGNYFVSTASGSERGFGGNYVNALYLGEVCMLDCDVTQGTSVPVGTNETTGIVLALSQGAGVQGRVAGPENENLVQVEVRIFDSNGFLAGKVKTDSQGRYQIDGLVAGDYFAHTVNNQDLADVTLGNSICEDECQPLDGDSFTVGATGFTENVDFELQLTDELFFDRFELD